MDLHSDLDLIIIGVLDTDIDETGSVELVKEALQNAVLANPSGYHAFLIVVKFAQRFTKEEQDSIKILKSILGKDVIKTHGIVNFLLQPPKELDLILIGKRGNGKSASGNSILNKKIFRQSDCYELETTYPSYDTCDFFGYKTQVVDCSGIFDSYWNVEQGNEMLFRIAIQNVVLANPKGYHAFIIVIRFGGRFTIDEIETIKLIKIILGEGVLEKYGIILMTNGDSFKRHPDLTLDSFCKKQTGFFKDILLECKNRIVVFDNVTDNEDTKMKQRQNLFEMVKSLNNNDQRYQNEHFKKAKQLLKNEHAYQRKDFINTQSFILDTDNPEILRTISEDVHTLKLKGADITPDEKNLVEPVKHLLANLDETQGFVVERIQAISNNTNTKHKQENADLGTRFQDILQSFQHSKKRFDYAYYPLLKHCVKKIWRHR
ncbi:uncharacterized protein LOC131945850 [Physella acuta]|uniref:uncharacterized protein LOC131945850 n=1 Tax=Physella acuta TaxID=109671 RepID=UPI0027DDC58A|nr:uncharacterized protein LOC131945850 [Physella acuta]